jgi:Cu+-exporting ATPase
MMQNEKAIDPVCGMTIDKKKAPFERQHSGETFYLCSAECATKFDVDGDAYATTARLNLPGWGLTPHPENVVKQFRQQPGN